jgi:hypothetical protein
MKRITKLTNRPMTRYLKGFVKICNQEQCAALPVPIKNGRNCTSGFWECSQQLFDNFGSCSSAHVACIYTAGSDQNARAACDLAYAACLAGAQNDYYRCNLDRTPQPWPVIHEARSQCDSRRPETYPCGNSQGPFEYLFWLT